MTTALEAMNVHFEQAPENVDTSGPKAHFPSDRAKLDLGVYTSVTTTNNESMLTEAGYAQAARRIVHALFKRAAFEDFEFGIESEFIRSLIAAHLRYGISAIRAIASVILNDQGDPEVTSEALRWLGRLDDAESYELRFLVLQLGLRKSSRWVRDGASLGLDAMNDIRAIPLLEQAIAHEPVPELRQDMELVLRMLRHGL